MRNEKEKYEEYRSLKRKGIVAICIIVAVIGLCVFFYLKGKQDKDKNLISSAVDSVEEAVLGQDGKVYTVTETSLEEVVTTGKLYTAEYPYNGYTAVYDEEAGDGTIKYYVAYRGMVKAGIDVSKIQVTLEKDSNRIIVRLPEVEIEEPVVDSGRMQYIFTKKKYETETVTQEAYKKAIEDLKEKVNADDSIVATATESAKAAEKALIEPWVNQVDSDRQYEVIVLGYGEEE